MTSKQAFRGGLTALAGILLCAGSFSIATAQQSKLRIIQTNSAGDNVHIIDAATNKVVGEIKGIEAPHGVAVAPDNSRIYISEQANNTVTVIDGKTLQVTKRIPLSGNPNLIEVAPVRREINEVGIAAQGNPLRHLKGFAVYNGDCVIGLFADVDPAVVRGHRDAVRRLDPLDLSHHLVGRGVDDVDVIPGGVRLDDPQLRLLRSRD